MRIALDARDLAGHPTGVGRYLAEIVRAWAEMPEARGHEFIACAPSAVTLPVADGLSLSSLTRQGHGIAWEQRTLPGLVRQAKADVLFAPGYAAPLTLRTPVVLTIHDVSFAAHPEWFRWREGLRLRTFARASARRAARVLTDSVFSQREIHEHLGVPTDRIDVIPLGISAVGAAQRRTTIGPALIDRAAPLLLYAGSVFNRRHLPELAEGFSAMARRHPEARLAIVGENRTFPWLDLGRLAARSDGRIDVTSYLPDADLAALYATARAFAFLSEYEGFGLTPLEALACGLPIVVLDTPLSREVYGDAAIYVARPTPALIERAVEQALFDEDERQRVQRAAPAVLARYSWHTCAARVLDALVGAV